MKKLFSFLMIGAAVALSSCAKTDPDKNGSGKEVAVIVNASVQGASATRATPAVAPLGYKFRYILEVYKDGQLATPRQMSFEPTLTVRLVTNNTYDFVTWADIVPAGNTDETVDNAFYDTTTGGLTAITLKPGATVNLNDGSRDAYYHYESIAIVSAWSVDFTLTRPFAQIRVRTTDMAWVLNSVVPAQVSIDYSKNVLSGNSKKFYTAFDASTGIASAPAAAVPTFTPVDFNPIPVPPATTTAALAPYSTTADEALDGWLTFDYLLANEGVADNDLVDFVVKFYDASGDVLTTKNISNIPIAQNTRTTVFGNLLTGEVTTNIIIDPEFSGNISVKLNDGNWQTVPDDYQQTEYFIPDYTISPTYTFEFPGTIASGTTITLSDETPGNASANYTGDVYLVFDNTPPIDLTLNLDLPFATVHLNGLVINSGTINATVSDHTLLIDGACKIGTLNLTKGNVEIGGVSGVVGTLNVASGCKVFWGVKTATELSNKIAAGATGPDDGCFLMNDITYTSNFTMAKPNFVLDGKGFTLTGDANGTSGRVGVLTWNGSLSNNGNGNNITLKDITVVNTESSANTTHCLNIVNSIGNVLHNVTLVGSGRSGACGINVNSASVTATGTIAISNASAVYGVGVSKGSSNDYPNTPYFDFSQTTLVGAKFTVQNNTNATMVKKPSWF